MTANTVLRGGVVHPLAIVEAASILRDGAAFFIVLISFFRGTRYVYE